MPNDSDEEVDFIFDTERVSVEVKPNDLIDFHYINYRGEARRRSCHVVRFIFGTTPHHPEPKQWFIIGEDPEKGYRTFSLATMTDIRVLYKARY